MLEEMLSKPGFTLSICRARYGSGYIAFLGCSEDFSGRIMSDITLGDSFYTRVESCLTESWYPASQRESISDCIDDIRSILLQADDNLELMMFSAMNRYYSGDDNVFGKKLCHSDGV